MHEARPTLVDGDDDAAAVHGGHLTVERAEDGAAQRQAFHQGLPGALHLGDVDRRAHVASEAVIPVEARDAAGEHRAKHAVGAAQPVLDGERPLGGQRGPVAAQAPRPVIGVNALEPPVTDFLGQRPARKAKPRAVEVDAAPVRSRHPHHDGRRVGHLVEPALAGLERVVRTPTHEGHGEEIGEQAQPVDEVCRPVALALRHAAREGTDDGPADEEGKDDDRAGAQRRERLPVACRLRRQVVQAGDADILAAAQPADGPRPRLSGEDGGRRGDAAAAPAVRRPELVTARGELREADPVEPQLVHRAMQPVRDLLVDLLRRDLDERRGQIGEENLEPQSLVEPPLHALPPPALDEQADDEQALSRCERDGSEHVPLVLPPERWRTEADVAAGGQAVLRDAPPRQDLVADEWPTHDAVTELRFGMAIHRNLRGRRQPRHRFGT